MLISEDFLSFLNGGVAAWQQLALAAFLTYVASTAVHAHLTSTLSTF